MPQARDDAPRIANYREFWPYYLGEHAKPETRRWHFFGTLVATLSVVLALVTWNGWFLLAALVAGYGPAWIGHLFVEKNRPATFRYPLWSLASDYHMTWAWLTGQLGRELEKAGLANAKSVSH